MCFSFVLSNSIFVFLYVLHGFLQLFLLPSFSSSYESLVLCVFFLFNVLYMYISHETFDFKSSKPKTWDFRYNGRECNRHSWQTLRTLMVNNRPSWPHFWIILILHWFGLIPPMFQHRYFVYQVNDFTNSKLWKD